MNTRKILDDIIQDILRTGDGWDAWDVAKTFGLSFEMADRLLTAAVKNGELAEDGGIYYVPDQTPDEYYNV